MEPPPGLIFASWRPHFGKILDPPLATYFMNYLLSTVPLALKLGSSMTN